LKISILHTNTDFLIAVGGSFRDIGFEVVATDWFSETMDLLDDTTVAFFTSNLHATCPDYPQVRDGFDAIREVRRKNPNIICFMATFSSGLEDHCKAENSIYLQRTGENFNSETNRTDLMSQVVDPARRVLEERFSNLDGGGICEKIQFSGYLFTRLLGGIFTKISNGPEEIGGTTIFLGQLVKAKKTCPPFYMIPGTKGIVTGIKTGNNDCFLDVWFEGHYCPTEMMFSEVEKVRK